MTKVRGRNPIAEVRQISHLALEVSDLEKSIAFYRELLGLEIFHDDRANRDGPNVKGAVAGFGIELLETGADQPGSRAGAPCLSFAVGNIEEAFATLKSRGLIEADAPAEVRGVRFFTVLDPDGFAIELIQFPAPLQVLADLKHWRG